MFYISFSSIIGTWSCLYVLLKCLIKSHLAKNAIILWNSVPICGGGAYSLHLASAKYLSLHKTFYFFTRPEITKWRICEHSSRYEVNNSIKLLILYGFFVLKKNYFFTFTAHEYDGLIVDGHNMNIFANKFGKWNPWLWFFNYVCGYHLYRY